MVRWQQRLVDGGAVTRRVAKRDAELIEFVYEELWNENYNNHFPDAEETK